MTEQYVPSEPFARSLYVLGSRTSSPDISTDQARAEFDRFLARVKRDAARGALDGLLERATQRRARAMTTSSRERHEDIHFAVQEYRDTHYPETEG